MLIQVQYHILMCSYQLIPVYEKLVHGSSLSTLQSAVIQDLARQAVVTQNLIAIVDRRPSVVHLPLSIGSLMVQRSGWAVVCLDGTKL